MPEEVAAVMGFDRAASRPVRLVGGRWRRIARRWRLFVATVPVVAPFAAGFVALRVLGPGAWVLLGAVGAVSVRWWWCRWRECYWRCRWVWDARAGGLARFAEPGIDLHYDSLDPADFEVAPVLLRVRVDDHGVRRYLIRPLPGSTRLELDLAAEVLRTRWRAISVQALADGSGGRWARGRVELVVITGSAVAHAIDLPDDDEVEEDAGFPTGFAMPHPLAIGAAVGLIIAAAAGGYGRGPVLVLVVAVAGAAAYRFRDLFAIAAEDPADDRD